MAAVAGIVWFHLHTRETLSVRSLSALIIITFFVA